MDRERGTPIHNPLKYPRPLLGIVVVLCTALSILACGFDVSDLPELVCTVIGTALGCLSALIAIKNADSSIHAEGFGWTVLLSVFLKYRMETGDTFTSLLTALKLAAGPIAVALFCPLPPVRKALTPLGALINPVVIYTLVSLPVVSVIVGSILMTQSPSERSKLAVTYAVPAALGIAAQIVYLLYYKNKNHDHGSLLVDKQKKGVVVATAFSIAYTIQMACAMDAETAILPLLVGSLMATICCATFASIADVWYPVGTGQFLMVSTDTASYLFYFVSPCIVLLGRFFLLYGEALSNAIVLLVTWVLFGVVPHTGHPAENLVTSGTLFLVGAATMVGVPLVNAWCPLGAHLFAWAYTHGQPSTKKVALCVFLRDLIDANATSQQNEAAIKSLCQDLVKDQKSTINIFVTRQDLAQSASAIRDCAIMGHTIGIAGENQHDVLETYYAYTTLLKTKPKWYHVDPSAICSSRTMRQVSKLGMKITYWSTYVAITGVDDLSNKQMDNIWSDVLKHNGGNIIYLQKEDSARGGEYVMEKALHHVAKDFSSEGYKIAPLSLVAREETPMDL